MWYENYLTAKDVIIQVLEKLITVADVHFLFCPSNHDYTQGFFLADVIKTWSNMEKGFLLWHPEEHEPLQWAIPPKNGDLRGAVHIAPQTWSEGVRQNLYIRFENFKDLTEDLKSYIKMDHCIVVAGLGFGEESLQTEQLMGYRIH